MLMILNNYTDIEAEASRAYLQNPDTIDKFTMILECIDPYEIQCHIIVTLGIAYFELIIITKNKKIYTVSFQPYASYMRCVEAE